MDFFVFLFLYVFFSRYANFMFDFFVLFLSCFMCHDASHATYAARHAPCVMRHVPRVARHAPCDMCHAPCVMRHVVRGMRHAQCDMLRASRFMRHESCALRPASSFTRCVAYVMRDARCFTLRASSAARHAPCAMRHVPCVMRAVNCPKFKSRELFAARWYNSIARALNKNVRNPQTLLRISARSACPRRVVCGFRKIYKVCISIVNVNGNILRVT